MVLQAIGSLLNVDSSLVTCYKGTVDGTTNGVTWTVKIAGWVNGYENNLHSHGGDPAITDWACNMCVSVGA